MKRLLLSFLFLTSISINAQVVIYGSESATSGDDWAAGDGFNAWSENSGANSGKFIGSPANNGMGTSNIGTTAFGFYATGGAYNNIELPFDEPMQVGETLSFYWTMNWDANGGTKGFDIQHSSSTPIMTVSNGGNSTITANSNNADTNYGTTPMLVTLERESSTTYQFSMTSRSGGSTYTEEITNSNAVNQIKIFIGNQNDSDGNRNIYFNHFKIKSNSANASVSNDRSLDNLEIENGATLTLTSAGSIQVAGTLTNNGTLKMQH